MLHIIEAAGWPIWPLMLASVIALAIIGERFWSLRSSIVAPRELLRTGGPGISPERRQSADCSTGSRTARRSPGCFAAALKNVKSSPRGDEGGHRRGRPRGRARTRALPHHARHHRHDQPAAGPARHDHRHDRDLRLAGALAAAIRSCLRTASRSRSTTPPSAHRGDTQHDLLPPLPQPVDSLVVEMESQAVKLVEIIHGERQA